MKTYFNIAVFRYLSTGILMGLLLVITALMYVYQYSYHSYFLSIQTAPPDFIFIILSPVLLGFIFYIKGLNAAKKRAAALLKNPKNAINSWNNNQPDNAGEPSFKLLLTVVAQINEAVMITDEKGCIQWINNSFTAITGFKLNEVAGKQTVSFNTGDLTQKGAIKNIKLNLFKGLPFAEELILYRKNGVAYWAHLNIQPVKNSLGAITNYICIETDINNKKELEKEIIQKEELEKEITDSNNKLQQGMQMAQFGTWEMDVVKKTLQLSKEVRQLFQLPLTGDIDMKKLMQCFHKDDVGRCRDHFKSLKNKKESELEYRIIINNETRYMVSSIAVKTAVDGILLGYFGTVKDNTDSKLSNLVLLQRNEEKSIVLDNAQALICQHDLDGVILDVNLATEKMSGYPKKSLIGRNLKSLIVAEHQNEFYEYLSEIKANHTAKGIFKIITRDGTIKVWHYQNALYACTGKAPYIIASAIDITESVEVKNEIEKHEHFISQIIDNSSNIIFVMNEQKQVVLSNSLFKEYYQCTDLKKPLAADLSKGDMDIFLGDADALMDLDDKENLRLEGCMKNADASIKEKWFHVEKKCFKDKAGNKYILVYGMDITGRYEIESDLIEANQLVAHSLKIKDQFISNMSHEIRTPLNAVMGFTDLLVDTKLNTQQLEYAQIVRAASQNLMALVNNILDMSKIESGSISLECLPIDVRQIVLDAAKIFEPKARSKKIKIFTHIADDIPTKLLGDQLRVSQIFYNIIGNAVKFTDTGFVEIKCKLVNGPEDMDYISFSIRDTGIGVPVEKQSMIFERFTQANTDTERLYGGTGLGLNIAKSIVDLHDGKLKMESIPGRGTSFQFTLPFQKFQASNAVSFETALEENQIQLLQTGTALKVLLAEDNPINAMLAIQVLENGGFMVTHVENGVLALNAVKETHFDVVLMDIQMPEMNGIIATKSIRNLQGPVAKIPIIAMTAHSLNGEMQNCYNAGMNGYISKPFKSENLFATIINVLNPINETRQQFFAMIDAA